MTEISRRDAGKLISAAALVPFVPGRREPETRSDTHLSRPFLSVSNEGDQAAIIEESLHGKDPIAHYVILPGTTYLLENKIGHDYEVVTNSKLRITLEHAWFKPLEITTT